MRKKGKRKHVYSIPNVTTRSGHRRIKMKTDAEITEEIVGSVEGENCCICLEQASIPLKLPCDHVFCYLCIKGVTLTQGAGRVCPLCRCPIPDEYIDHANMSRKLFKTLHVESELDCQWKYRGRGGGWWLYDDETNQIVEEYYQKYLEDFKELNGDSDSEEEMKSDEGDDGDDGEGESSKKEDGEEGDGDTEMKTDGSSPERQFSLVVQSDDEEDEGNDDREDDNKEESNKDGGDDASNDQQQQQTSSSSSSSSSTPASNSSSSSSSSSSTSSSLNMISQPPKKKQKLATNSAQTTKHKQPDSKICTVVVGNGQYFIDFEKMMQISVQDSKKTRRIRRGLMESELKQKNTKGQAGVQFSKK